MERTKLLFVLCITIITLSTYCDSPTGSENLQPGRRDYIWSLDSLTIPYTVLQRIWGSAPDDVWAVGPGGDLDKTIYHFNGTEWENDGVSRILSPLTVFGFGRNDVWFAGREGRIWHYNGQEFEESTWFRKNGYFVGFQDLWGDSPNNIYATGYADSISIEYRRGIILHNNGNNWGEVNIPFIPYNFMRIKRGIKENPLFYIWGEKTTPLAPDSVGLFELNGNNVRQIYKGRWNSEGQCFVQEIDGKLYFVIGNNIYKYVNREFVLWLDINEPQFGMQIFGRNEKDIFLRMEDGIAHYNGSNIEYIYHTEPHISVSEGVLFENVVVFLALDRNTYGNIIISGKLN